MVEKLVFELPFETAEAILGPVSEGLVFLSNHGFDIPRSWIIPRESLGPSRKDALERQLDLELPEAGLFVSIEDKDLIRRPRVTEGVHIGEGGAVGSPRPFLSGAIKSWRELLDQAVDQPYGLVVQKIMEYEAIGAASSANLATGADEIVIERPGTRIVVVPEANGKVRKKKSGHLERHLEAVAAGVRSVAASRGSTVCLWWGYSSGKIRWRRLKDAPITPTLPTYTAKYEGLLSRWSKPLVWQVDSDIVTASWSRMLKEMFGIRFDQDFTIRRFFNRTYVNLSSLVAATGKSGFPMAPLDALMSYGPSPNGLSLALGPKTVSILPRLATRVLHDPTFEERVCARAGEISKGLDAIVQEDFEKQSAQELVATLEDVSVLLREAATLNLEAAAYAYLFGKLFRMRLSKLGVNPSSIRPAGARMGGVDGIDGVRIDEHGIAQEAREKAMDLQQKAVRHTVLKEQTEATFSLGYAIYRKCFVPLGRRMVETGLLVDPDDVQFLTLDEVKQIVEGGCSTNTCNNYRLRVVLRKREMAEDVRGVLPLLIYGEKAPVGFSELGKDLEGTPGSGGYCLGPAKFLSRSNDIEHLEKGDVAVLPDTCIAWAPILDTASGLVATSGSIFAELLFLAREKGIPAVVDVREMSTGQEGSRVAVDGYLGTVRTLAPAQEWKVAGLPDLSGGVRS